MITILGPTASGKTKLAVALADALGGEIISADSRQVYRGMDIGTGKDLSDYTLESGRTVPYHLIDICDAGEKYNLFRYQQDFRNAYDDICVRGRIPILCGGTGLYIESVLKNYSLKAVPENPELRRSLEGMTLQELTRMLEDLKAKTGSNMHNKTDVDSCKRAIRAIEIEMYSLDNDVNQQQIGIPSPDSNPADLIFGTDIPRDLRRQRITERLDQRLAEGMVAEVKTLLDSGIAPDDLIYYGLEYKFLTLYLTGALTYTQMRAQLETAIHQFAKRQMTWFRGMERRGLHINWIDYSLPMDEKVAFVKSIIIGSYSLSVVKGS
ncbi:MAG: tRNA (adenosine(37)-N6)-dimethylallyltransferase MiaA [Bacteroidaceae bacterium]|nr:tRNA (adenosine(37)-N6)-dimethylallyltransferase MiaA [Bacteroidaceae bacterium]